MGNSDEATPKKTSRFYSDSPEEHENRMIALAMSEVEDRIRKHTATSQELTHFLKLATTRERLEKEKLEREIEFLKAKKEALESTQQYEAMVKDALNSLKRYSGNDEDEIYDYEED